MKRNILSALTALLVLHATAYTQTTKPRAPVKTGNEWKMPSDVFQRAKTYSADLQKKLGLDSAQTKKVYDVFLANTKPLDEIAVAAVSDKEKEAMRKSNQVALNEKMRNIFTAGQYKTYMAIKPAM